MFSITTKINYGLLAMLDLAEYYGIERVQLKDIVHRKKVPRPFIEQILSILTKQGLVKGIRGTNGGYVLSKAPEHITLLEIIEVIEGSLKLKKAEHTPVLQQVFACLEADIKRSLSMSLSQLLDRKQTLDGQLFYQI